MADTVASGRTVVLHASVENGNTAFAGQSKLMDNPRMTSQTGFVSTWTPLFGDGGSTFFSTATGDAFTATSDTVTINGTSFLPFKAFDKLVAIAGGVHGRAIYDTGLTAEFLPISTALTYSGAYVLRSYAVSAQSSDAAEDASGETFLRAPKSWTIEGSNNFNGSVLRADGTADHSAATWSVLDRVVDYALPINGLVEFPVANTAAYSAYRMVVSANNGSRYMQISELVFRTERTLDYPPLYTGDTTFTLGENLFANREYDANGFPLKRPLKMALVQQRGLPADRIITVDFPTENQFCHPTKPGGVVALTTAVSNIVHPIYTRTNFDSISSIRVRVLKADGTLDEDLAEPYFMVLHFV